MTDSPKEDSETRWDSLLDNVIDELRLVFIPEMPPLVPPVTARPSRPKSRLRVWGVIVASAAVVLIGWIIWSPTNTPQATSPARPPVDSVAASPMVVPQPETAAPMVPPLEIVSSAAPRIDRLGLIARSSISAGSASDSTPESSLAAIDELQAQLDQLNEIVLRSSVEDRTRQLLEDLRRLVATAH